MTKEPDFPWRRLGELLIERGLIDEDELDEALEVQAATGRRLGEILVERDALGAPELIAALAHQYGLDVRVEPRAAEPERSGPDGGGSWQPLGRILVERGSLGRDALRSAIAEQRRSGGRLGTILVDGGHVSPVALVEALAEQHGLARHSLVAASTAAPAETAYEVVDGEGATLFRTAGFLDATDFAFELLESERPAMLEIFRRDGDEREQVWSYTEERAEAAAAARRDTLEIYGFDVTRWTGPPR